MGCDITMHIEYRPNKNVEYCHFAKIPINRDYLLFCSFGYYANDKLLGPVKIKGFPACAISKKTFESLNEKEDALFPSWMNLDELNKCINHYNENIESIYSIDIEIIIVRDIMKSFNENGWDSRIIFWFDI